MKDDARDAPIAKPTEERTSDQSTPGASGLTGRGQTEDVAARTGRGEDVPRRYDEGLDDGVMSAENGDTQHFTE